MTWFHNCELARWEVCPNLLHPFKTNFCKPLVGQTLRTTSRFTRFQMSADNAGIVTTQRYLNTTLESLKKSVTVLEQEKKVG